MRLARLGPTLLVLAALAGSTTAGAQAKASPQVRTIAITAGDPDNGKMLFSVSEIVAKPGERLRIQLVSIAQMPKAVMGHNWVLLKLGVDPKAFSEDAAFARDTDYIPPKRKGQILAYTEIIGPGERAEITFTVPKVPGKYPF